MFWDELGQFWMFTDVLGCFFFRFWDVLGFFMDVLGCIWHVLAHFVTFWDVLGRFGTFLMFWDNIYFCIFVLLYFYTFYTFDVLGRLMFWDT